MARLTFALLLLAGCAALFGPAAVRWVDAPRAKRAPPTLPRRDECLKPPYTLGSSEPTTLHGLRAAGSPDRPRELMLSSSTGAPLEADALLELQERLRPALMAIDGAERVSLSGCQLAARQVPCLSLQLSLCAEPLDALASELAALLEREPSTRGRQVVFQVVLAGAAGPRCEADDPRCRPEAYEGAPYRPGERRGLLTELPRDDDPVCSWDGECAKSSCGGDCVPWTIAHQPGTCTEQPKLESALCGCVDHHCAWFVQ